MESVRPTQLGMSSEDIRTAAAELADLFRVMVWEWVVAFVGHPGEGSDDHCLRHFKENYDGKIPEDGRRVIDWPGQRKALELRVPNPRAEWKTEALAEAHAEKLREDGYEVTVVIRNSRADHDLRKYGRVLLPGSKRREA